MPDSLRDLTAADLLVIGFAALLAVIAAGLALADASWLRLAAVDVGLVSGVILLARARARSRSAVLAAAHDWYVAPVIFLLLKHVHYVLGGLRPVDRDDWLIAADRWLFGLDPTVWLSRVTSPALTELLQVAYTAFYVLFLVVGYELYFRRPRADYRWFVFACAYGFFLSYVAYVFVPAVGPRFTLHRFSDLDAELPGLWLTPALRAFVNAGGSIPSGVPDAVARAAAQRDVFPSGHTMMTFALVAWAWRFRLRVAPSITAAGALVIAGTVYLRYHYVVDLVAGGVMALVVLVTVDPFYRAVIGALSVIDCRDRDRVAGTEHAC